MLLFDIAGFSRLSNEKQYVAIQVVSDALRNAIGLLSNQSFLAAEEWILDVLPTGDGFYVLLNPRIAGYGPLLALSLRSSFGKARRDANGLFDGVRTAVNLGPMIPFVDARGQKNWAGDGLNDCARYLSCKDVRAKGESLAGGPDFVVVSDAALEQFGKMYSPTEKRMREFLSAIKYREVEEIEFTDNHGKAHRGTFIEASRHVLLKPPPPVDLQSRMDAVAREAIDRANGEDQDGEDSKASE